MGKRRNGARRKIAEADREGVEFRSGDFFGDRVPICSFLCWETAAAVGARRPDFFW